MTALPWVLLGKRVQYQPHLDTSASQLVLGKAVKIPGQLLGQPGPPLNTAQTRQLLDQLYKLSSRPPIQTSSPVTEKEINNTLNATHVYVKQANPQSLCPKFEGPFEIKSRPSRSTIQVKIGTYANGDDRLLVFHWSSCKIAHMREGAPEGSRPQLGRRPKTTQPVAPDGKQNSRGADIQTQDSSPAEPSYETISGKRPHPGYLEKGPLITREMFDKFTPDIFEELRRPARATRNQNPVYK